MTRLPETGLEYYTYQFSGADDVALNDKETIEGMFRTFNTPDQRMTFYPFDGQGVTAISISPEGTVHTIHTWPHQSEHRFGIVTEYQGSSTHRATARTIADTFKPGPVVLEHTPRINHAVAAFEMPTKPELLDPMNLALHLDSLVRASDLKGVSTHMTARELPLLKLNDPYNLDLPYSFRVAIAGQVLTNSSIVMVAEHSTNAPDKMSVVIDCMTCEERDMRWLPVSIYDRYQARRLYIATQQFGPQSKDEGEVVSARSSKDSQVFMRKFSI